MAEKVDGKQTADQPNDAEPEAKIGESIAVGIDDVGTIPKGALDPVYEAKARVLNRAVCRHQKRVGEVHVC